METEFNNIEWHDLIINSLHIDRLKSGLKDTIDFEIKDDTDKCFLLSFSDVYWANLNLNFGIIVDETILEAVELDKEDKDLVILQQKWEGANLDDLKVFEIILNSSNSVIKIIARKFEFKVK